MTSLPQDAERAKLNRGWFRLGVLAGLLGVAALFKAGIDYKRSWYVSFNWTESLPNWAFLVDKKAMPETGDFIDFWPPENPYYEGVSFVKQIVAGPGDVVSCEGREFYVAGELVATAKETSTGGDPLSLGPCGDVPDGHYFVVAPHKDSFDSRYGEIGYVPFRAIRGVASPIL